MPFHVLMFLGRWDSKVKGTFRWIIPLWNHSLKKIEVLTQRRDVINPKSARKRVQTSISCTNSDRKIKIKTKRNFEIRYSLMKLFPGNFKILAPCCEVIISKSGQKDSSLYIMYNWLKNIPEKSGTFPLKIYIDLVLILLPQIVFYISVWFHFGITLIFLSRFAQDMHKFNMTQFQQ